VWDTVTGKLKKELAYQVGKEGGREGGRESRRVHKWSSG
jgi:hypothetical protein